MIITDNLALAIAIISITAGCILMSVGLIDVFGKLILGDTKLKWFNKGIEHQKIKQKYLEKDLLKRLSSTKGKPEGIITDKMIKSIFRRYK